MTDTPSPAASSTDTVSVDESFWGRFDAERARAGFGFAYFIAVVITAAAVWLVAAAPGATSGTARGSTSQAVLFVLLANLALISGLAFIVGRRVLALARSTGDAGSRLHLRFVALFSMVAVVPAVLIALVFGLLVTRGVDQWFSQNVQASVENGAVVGRAYIRDVATTVDADLVTISDQLDSARGLFDDRIQFNDALAQVGEIFGYPAIYILNGDGQVLARAERPDAPPYLAPPRTYLEDAAQGGKPPTDVTQNPDTVRSIIALPAYGDAYLYLVRPLQDGLVARMNASIQSIEAYREAQESRSRIQSAFILSYLETALLVLVGAVWLGMSAASSISAPIGRLVQAADQVAGGDFSARVDSQGAPAEIALLSDAFNRMTGDLQAQQTALKAASDEAQNRSRFIETVLSGVSAGVIGLDRRGRVSAINDSALQLLHIEEDEVLGHELAALSPELSDLVGRVEAHIEEDIDVSRGGETQRLRVRIEGGQGGEMVLTFDDITRLVTAQRNAAWRDVARRIAHEIKNPLTPIQLSAERLEIKLADKLDDPGRQLLTRSVNTIVTQVQALKSLINEFRDYARLPSAKLVPLNLNELISEVMALYGQALEQGTLSLDLAPDLPAIQGDAALLRQVVHNLVQNALDAAHDRTAEHGPAHVIVRTDTPRNEDGSIRAVRLAVRDNGPGFPDKVLRRAFEPYLTTKAKGTGLGLAVVKKIADEHKALVRIRNLTANPSQPPIETGAQGNSPGAPRSAGAQVSLSFSVLSSIPHQSGSH